MSKRAAVKQPAPMSFYQFVQAMQESAKPVARPKKAKKAKKDAG